MSPDIPDYTTLKPPEDISPEDYSYHERRAEILQALIEGGSPSAIKQVDLAERYDVHESTISRDMDALRESIREHVTDDSLSTTWLLREHIVADLLDEDDWRARKAAWDVQMDWNDWLGEIGEQHREPDRSELDVRSRNVGVTYEVIRPGDGEELPRTDDGTVDYDALGFTNGPVGIEVEATGETSNPVVGSREEQSEADDE